MERDHDEIIRTYSAVVFRCAYAYVKNRHDAEDIMQEVFLKYLVKKPSFRDETHEKAWFIRVTINMSKNFLGSFWMQKRDDLPEVPAEAPETDRSAALWAAVSALPEKYRIAVVMHYIEGCSIKEISRILRRNPSTVGTWLERGKHKLKQILEEQDDEGL